VGGVTGVAMWRFWPQEKSAGKGVDLGKRLADRTKAAMPLPAAGSLRRDVGTQTSGVSISSSLGPAAVMGEPAVLPVAANTVKVKPVVPSHLADVGRGRQDEYRWWKNLFWKQAS
jgi:hypothetical protein